MTLNSLYLKSEMLFWERSAEIRDLGDMLAVLATEDPKRWLGNIFILERAPASAAIPALIEKIDKTVRRYSNVPHYVIMWQEGTLDDKARSVLAAARLEYDAADVLTLGELRKPEHFNCDVEILEVGAEDPMWTDLLRLDVECFSHGNAEWCEIFTRKRFADYRKLIEERKGVWYAAILDGALAGSCGLFAGDGFYRYQQIAIRKEFRRQGVASSMLYHAASHAARPNRTQVIVADQGDPAEQVYLSLGFLPISVAETIKRRKTAPRPVLMPKLSL